MAEELVAEVNNLPSKVSMDDYIVVRVCQGELWYYSRFSSEEDAKQSALEVNGFVMRFPR